MKVHNTEISQPIPKNLALWLNLYRHRKSFKPAEYIYNKTKVINEYFTGQGLKSAVVAVSGGVDSALVLSLVVHAASQPNSPIKKIFAVTLPAHVKTGATGQAETVTKAEELCKNLNVILHTIPVTMPQETIKTLVDASSNQIGEAWASGQLVAYTRTPILYYITSLLTEANTTGVICGTTNRDEGAFLGYVGKASDGMVDLQLISDLHKSEVYLAAKHLNVPESILGADPTGDMFDGRTDTDVFGATYDDVELFLAQQENFLISQKDFISSLSATDFFYWKQVATNLAKLHQHNHHKYIGYSPAVHLDIGQSGIYGGWPEYGYLQQIRLSTGLSSSSLPTTTETSLKHAKALSLANADEGLPAGSAWQAVAPGWPPRAVGQFDLSQEAIPKDNDPEQTIIKFPLAYLKEKPRQHKEGETMQCSQEWSWHKDSVKILPRVLKPNECQKILQAIPGHIWQPVGLDGKHPGFNNAMQATGSKRASCYSQELAQLLWRRIAGHIPMLRHMNARCPTAWAPHDIWQAVGISPLFRFISYDAGHQLIPHYDETYVFHDQHRTLMSFVMYLTTADEKTGGETRFLKDSQSDKPLSEWSRVDHPAPAHTAPVHFSITPEQGQAVVFDHYLLHDALPVIGNKPKIIVRSDIEFIARHGHRMAL